MFSLKIAVGNSEVVLLGPDIEAPVKGCRRRPWKESGELVEEQIEVILQGAPGTIDGWLRMLEAKFSQVATENVDSSLVMQTDQRVSPYESRLVSGKIGFMGHGSADMKYGGMGVLLTLVREVYWESGLQAAPVSNVHGSEVVDGLVIDNQFDSSGSVCNYAVIGGSRITGELPAPAWLSIENISSGKVLGKVLIGQDCFYGLQAADGWLEGELAIYDASVVTLTAVVDAGACKGGYGLASWSGTAEIELLAWSISGEAAVRFGGRMVRPVLRLAALPESDDLLGAVGGETG